MTPGGTSNFDTFNGSLASGTPESAALWFLADMNGSGNVTNADTTLYGQALNDAPAYKTARPNLNFLRGDINGSGTITNADTVRFGNILNDLNISGSGSVLSSVPEPASVVLVGFVLAFASLARRRSR
jgi:hypothetical protein